ncbi:MAG: hypothetical protein ING71_02685 [Rhodocyclaceae bacterium]|nr:hypothetical protein [Rhodocyclaceae bacterium]
MLTASFAPFQEASGQNSTWDRQSGVIANPPQIASGHYEATLRCLAAEAEVQRSSPVAIIVDQVLNPLSTPLSTDESLLFVGALTATKSELVRVYRAASLQNPFQEGVANFVVTSRLMSIDGGINDPTREIAAEGRGVSVSRSRNRSTEVARMQVVISEPGGRAIRAFTVVATRQPTAKSLSIGISLGRDTYLAMQTVDVQANGPGELIQAMYFTASIAVMRELFAFHESKCLRSGPYDPLAQEFDQSDQGTRIDAVAAALVRTGHWQSPDLLGGYIPALKTFQKQYGLRETGLVDRDTYIQVRAAALKSRPNEVNMTSLAFSQAVADALSSPHQTAKAESLRAKAEVKISKADAPLSRANLSLPNKICAQITGRLETPTHVKDFPVGTYACQLSDGIWTTWHRSGSTQWILKTPVVTPTAGVPPTTIKKPRSRSGRTQ